MRDHDDEAVLRDLLEEIHDLHGGLGVECAGRFVGEQDLRVIDQGAGDCHTLHLTAGHLVRLLVDLVAEAHLFEHLLCALSALRLGDARERQCELDICEHALVRDEIVGLEDKADRVIAVIVPVLILILFCRFACDDEVAGGVAVESADNVQQRGLAAAGGSEHCDKFIFAEHDVDALQRLYLSVAGRVVLGNAFEPQHMITTFLIGGGTAQTAPSSCVEYSTGL